MKVCPQCGVENPDGFRLCGMCGAQLSVGVAGGEQRKLVSVLFCDIVGSTSLGEKLEPESLRRVLADYFRVSQHAIDVHGGSVEKFIGDAVMAVFGIPLSHEDDAFRAVRAAADIRDGVLRLNKELEPEYGTPLQVRIGVCSGEVITGTEERLATGDVLNTAARLEQAAGPGEILFEGRTLRLVRSAVDVEAMEPLELRGKSEPTPTYRLVHVYPEAIPVARHLDSPLVGRRAEQRLLNDEWERVVTDSECRLVTLVGTAGVGKSRLAAEFIGSVDLGTVLRARCLPYGEGISYWPIVEILKQLGDRLEELLLDETVKSALAVLLTGEGAASSEDVAFAVRRVLEELAKQNPLVVVFDDIHWGEQTFLDLIRYIVQYSRGSAILLLCLSRPELLDKEPEWPEVSHQTIKLEPLSDTESQELINTLASELDPSLVNRVLKAAGGNPLFVEEMVALIREQGAQRDGKSLTIPTTIHALIGARLDQLELADRVTLQHGAVEGEVFHRGAIRALDSDSAQIDGSLLTLVNKDLVRPARPQLLGDEAYRFRHLLIRDTAYNLLPKNTRAELHERLANWFESHAPELVELHEIVGYHLEQASNYKRQLKRINPALQQLAERAGSHLLEAGRRALRRNDIPATKNLLTRARSLLGEDSSEAREALLGIAMALRHDSFADAKLSFEELLEVAHKTGDERLEVLAELGILEAQKHTNPQTSARKVALRVEELVGQLELLSDQEGLARALLFRGQVVYWLGDCGRAAKIWNFALKVAREARQDTRVAELLVWLAWAALWSPLPTNKAIERCNEIAHYGVDNSYVTATCLVARGFLGAMRGDFAQARFDAQAGRQLMSERGMRFRWAASSLMAAQVELWAGKPDVAETLLAEAQPAMVEAAAGGYSATLVAERAYAVALQGRYEEASKLADEAEKYEQTGEDFVTIVQLGAVRTRTLLHQADIKGATNQAQVAVNTADQTDWIPWRIRAWQALGEVGRCSDQPDLEIKALREIARISRLKQDLVSEGAAERRLIALGERSKSLH